MHLRGCGKVLLLLLLHNRLRRLHRGWDQARLRQRRIFLGFINDKGGRTPALGLARNLAVNGVGIGKYQSLALAFKVFPGGDFPQGQLFLPLLNADVQSLQILNDASRFRWRLVRLHAAPVVVAVRALIIKRELFRVLAN